MPAEGKITLDAKQYEAMLAQVQTKTAAATDSMSKSVGKFGSGFGKVGSAIGQISGSAPAAFGQIGSAISTLVMGPMGALIAAIGIIAAAAADLWDRMTLSSDEYAHKTEMAAERANKAWSKQQKQHGEDQGYMDRLVELAKKERLSNEAKAEAAQLISMLTSRYGKLGITIDDVTGAIKGADEAQKRMLERQRQEEIRLLESRMRINRNRVRTTAKGAMEESLGDTKAINLAILSRLGIPGYLAARYLRGKKYAATDKQVRGASTEELIEKFTQARDSAKTTAQMEKWQKAIDALETQLELEQRLKNLRDRGSATESAAAARARKESENTQKKVDFVEGERKQVEYQMLINAGKTEEAEMLKLINDLKQRGVELSEEEARAMVQGRQALAGDAQYRKTKEDLEQQLYIQRQLLQGDRERARDAEVANQFFARGNSVYQEQVDKIKKLQRELESVELRRSQQGQYNSLYEQALRASGRGREADEFAALEAARAKKGGAALTDQERAATLRMVELQRQLQNSSPVSSLAISANSLTARGGGGGRSAAQSAADRYNHEMLAKAGSTNTLLADIKLEITRLMGTTPDPAY